MITAYHVSDYIKTMSGFATIEQAVAAIGKRPGSYIVDIHDDGAVIWSDFPQSSGREIPFETVPISLNMLLSR